MSNKYRINEFAKRVGLSTRTIMLWKKEGKLIAIKEDFPNSKEPKDLLT